MQGWGSYIAAATVSAAGADMLCDQTACGAQAHGGALSCGLRLFFPHVTYTAVSF